MLAWVVAGLRLAIRRGTRTWDWHCVLPPREGRGVGIRYGMGWRFWVRHPRRRMSLLARCR